MKILKVIHGYPPRYNAGSEVYSQMLCHELARQGHEVIVFTRQENAYQQEYSVEWEVDSHCLSVKICLINMAHAKDGYQHPAVDAAFASLLDLYSFDVVHIGHLNHLSTSLVTKAHERKIPIVFTLHDFWLMCPRGQFLQGINSKGVDLYPVCDSQEDKKCARNCYWRYFSCSDDEVDINYWSNWVGKRMDHVREITAYVDLFIAPSRYLMNRFIDDFGISPSQIHYLDYGFHRDRLKGRVRNKDKEVVFGYIGTHKQAKGIHHLLQAFSQIQKEARLKIWGAPLQPFTQSLQTYLHRLGPDIFDRVEWMGGYQNENLVSRVFNHIDAIVVPSIWGENSPLVIHEALEAKVPVITANYGGMKEYIQHEVNGLLFEHRNPNSLAQQLQRFIDDPNLGDILSRVGYLQSNDGRIPSVEGHVEDIIHFYTLAQRKRGLYECQTGSLAYHV